MYKTILVGLDGSSYAASAEDLAVALARRLDAVVEGVHVLDSSLLEGAFITDISGAMGFEPFLNLQAQMQSTLQEVGDTIGTRFRDRCRETGVECRFHLERASVPQGICKVAKLADLMVVGQRGVNARFHEDLLGPTTEVLLRRSPIPLMVVPVDAGVPRRPLAAYDGSPKAARALHYAAEFCRQLQLPLTVVTVDQDDERAAQRLAEAIDYLKPFEIEVEVRHERSDAAEEALLALLGPDHHDLVFLGAHGHSRIVELVLGSTSEFLARQASVPVFCVTRA